MKPDKETRQMINEIADDVIRSLNKKSKEPHRNIDIDILEKRIVDVEHRMSNNINNFKIVATEVERMVTEKFEQLNEEYDNKIVDLRGEIQDLWTKLIVIGNEVKKIRKEIGFKAEGNF